MPVGIVTAIRGSVRYRFGQIRGQTTHAGGVPRSLRHDAVLAGAELATTLEAEWIRLEESGHDLVLTIGQFATDATMHGITKVPGAVDFTLDFRSVEPETLSHFDRFVQQTAAEIADRRGVTIDLGSSTRAREDSMDPDLRAALLAAADRTGWPATELVSGGGHDCAVFAGQGVPSAMIFVRNENGSHNPDEAMTFEDFTAAWQVLRSFARDLLALD